MNRERVRLRISGSEQIGRGISIEVVDEGTGEYVILAGATTDAGARAKRLLLRHTLESLGTVVTDAELVDG